MNKSIEFFKQYYLIVVIICLCLSIFFNFLSNDYELNSKTIDTVKNGKVFETTYYKIDSKKPIFEILSAVFLNLGISTFIAIFFVNYLDKKEKQEFEDKLMEFQKKTAKDAIESVFNRTIEKEFFDIIKYDLLNAKLL